MGGQGGKLAGGARLFGGGPASGGRHRRVLGRLSRTRSQECGEEARTDAAWRKRVQAAVAR